MNDNAKAWVAALRSGKYLQGKHRLRTNDKYCCLGVACELAVNAGIIPEPVSKLGFYEYDHQQNYLPFAVQKWFNLINPTGSAGSISLTALNDSGASFEAIADTIERTPDLFERMETCVNSPE